MDDYRDMDKARIHELEEKVEFLKGELDQLANFNPDWDRLQAAQASLREYMQQLNTANKRIEELEEAMEQSDYLFDTIHQIKAWCEAYPLAVFPEPDWVEVRDRLGDKLTSRVGASNMRHVVVGIGRIITECEKNHSQ
jgi:tetrahydromethanopterin S-methyltransferase subunit G